MIIVIIRYKGINDNANKFVNEMISSGLVDSIRIEEGNIKYEYFYPFDENQSVLLIDSWIMSLLI